MVEEEGGREAIVLPVRVEERWRELRSSHPVAHHSDASALVLGEPQIVKELNEMRIAGLGPWLAEIVLVDERVPRVPDLETIAESQDLNRGL